MSWNRSQQRATRRVALTTSRPSLVKSSAARRDSSTRQSVRIALVMGLRRGVL